MVVPLHFKHMQSPTAIFNALSHTLKQVTPLTSVKQGGLQATSFKTISQNTKIKNTVMYLK
jgi:hypothetical protein